MRGGWSQERRCLQRSRTRPARFASARLQSAVRGAAHLPFERFRLLVFPSPLFVPFACSVEPERPASLPRIQLKPGLVWPLAGAGAPVAPYWECRVRLYPEANLSVNFVADLRRGPPLPRIPGSYRGAVARRVSTQCFAFTPVPSAIWWRQEKPQATTVVASWRLRITGNSRCSAMPRDIS